MSNKIPDDRRNKAAGEKQPAAFNEKRADRLNALTVAAMPCIMIAGLWTALTVHSYIPALIAALLLAGVLLSRRYIRRDAEPKFCPSCGSDNVIRDTAAGDIVSPLVAGVGTNVSNESVCGHCGHRW